MGVGETGRPVRFGSRRRLQTLFDAAGERLAASLAGRCARDVRTDSGWNFPFLRGRFPTRRRAVAELLGAPETTSENTYALAAAAARFLHAESRGGVVLSRTRPRGSYSLSFIPPVTGEWEARHPDGVLTDPVLSNKFLYASEENMRRGLPLFLLDSIPEHVALADRFLEAVEGRIRALRTVYGAFVSVAERTERDPTTGGAKAVDLGFDGWTHTLLAGDRSGFLDLGGGSVGVERPEEGGGAVVAKSPSYVSRLRVANPLPMPATLYGRCWGFGKRLRVRPVLGGGYARFAMLDATDEWGLLGPVPAFGGVLLEGTVDMEVPDPDGLLDDKGGDDECHAFVEFALDYGGAFRHLRPEGDAAAPPTPFTVYNSAPWPEDETEQP